MKHFRRLSFLIILAILMSPSAASAAETAAQILAKCATKVNNAPALTVKFRLTFGNGHSDCTMTMAKEKYRLSSKEMEVWYDGSTMWTYSTASKELSITDPTDDELLECNPFAILNGVTKVYNAHRLKGQSYEIELTAKAKGSTIRKAVVSINPKTYLPTKLVVTLSNGRTFSAAVTSSAVGKAVPASTFIYNKSKFPAKETIDLR